jgi:serine/threonine protein phosphatase 1
MAEHETMTADWKPERLIAIGDIHGELGKLELLLNWVSPAQNDQFVFLGDYIDRGQDSRGVIERLMGFGYEFPQTIFLRGNHEQMLLDSLAEIERDRHGEIPERKGLRLYNSDLEMFLANGGNETLRSYGLTNLDGIPVTHLEFIESTRLWWRHDNFLFVHAGAAPNTPLEKQDPVSLLMDRHSPPGENGIIHVVGHTPTSGEPYFEPGRYNLDTGAVFGQSLTACDVLTKTVWQM